MKSRNAEIGETENPQYSVSPDCTHHLDENGMPVYNARFLWVWKFAQGRAPVRDESGAYHIFPDGSAVYEDQYEDVFGFYERRGNS